MITKKENISFVKTKQYKKKYIFKYKIPTDFPPTLVDKPKLQQNEENVALL